MILNFAIREKLQAIGLSSAAREELALLILGWAKISTTEKISPHLRLTSQLLEEPKAIEAAFVELGNSSDSSLQVFAQAALLVKDKAHLLIPALRAALNIKEQGFLPVPWHLLLIPLMEDSIEGAFSLDAGLELLLFQLLSLEADESVYLPWDSLGQLAAEVAEANGNAYVETPLRTMIPGSIGLTCPRQFDIHFSDPIRNPSAVQEGRPIQFDRAVSFPPIGMRYEKQITDTDWHGRFPEKTSNGTILNIRHMLWQTTKRAVIAVPNNVLFSTGAEQEFRQDLLKRGMVQAVIAMHSGMLRETSIPFSILVLSPQGGHKNVRFVLGDADRFIKAESKARFSLKDARQLAEVVFGGDDTDEARTIPVDQIAGDAQLQPNRYVLPAHTLKLLSRISNAQTVALRDLVQTVRPMSTKPGKSARIEVREIGASDLPAYGYIREAGRTVEIDSYVSGTNDEQYLRTNDIVLIVKGSVGKLGIIHETAPGPGPGGWIAGQSSIVLRVKDEAKVNAKALALQLRSEMGQGLLKNIVSGATIPLIQLRELMEMPILLPSMEEQRRAANVLDEEDEIQQQIDDLRQRQSRVAQDMWTLEN